MGFRFSGLLCSSLFACSATGLLFGQSVAIGAVGGLRPTDDFQYAATSESRPYVVGPSVEVTLPLGFAVGFEALYQRQGYSTAGGNVLASTSIREADNVGNSRCWAAIGCQSAACGHSPKWVGSRGLCMATATRAAASTISHRAAIRVPAAVIKQAGPQRTGWRLAAASNSL